MATAFTPYVSVDTIFNCKAGGCRELKEIHLLKTEKHSDVNVFQSHLVGFQADN